MMLVMVMVMVVLMTSQVSGARCCGPRQWAGEVRRVTVNTTLPDTSDTPEWHWVSYDFDTKKVAVITFDPRPGKSDLYRRELLDFSEGMRYVTQDEVTCRSSRLNGTIPRLCVPPSGGNITLDIRKFFGVYPEPTSRFYHRSLPRPIASESHRLVPNAPGKQRRNCATSGDESMGMYAETIHYETDDVIGYVTVTSLTCSFVSEMTYTTEDGGSLVWQHTQWNNLTLTVNPESFNMPKSCFTTSPDTVTTAGAQIPTAYGRMAQILNLL
ncbi:uncharacterized protein LOC143278070 isoform X1 [Babylonia areolata]|uniref:uncharacterized protein LOC143278070 isoform X1 n=1 Tax=Babylonia areolata TaxID=304850 RepID=UPI003FD4ED19